MLYYHSYDQNQLVVFSATETAWTNTYEGDTAGLLKCCLDEMNGRRGKDNYRNATSIVQSSGTGKSRAVDEVAKKVFTIPFNLRPDKHYGAWMCI